MRDERESNHEIEGIHLIFIELEKRKKLGNFNMENPIDRWPTFLAEPEKLKDMSKFDISVYPNLIKAVELLDESNYTEAQLYAYDKHLLAVADINQSRIESFDQGFDEGMEKTIAILKALRENNLSKNEIAEKFNISPEVVDRLAGV